jgi:hypothetical protein
MKFAIKLSCFSRRFDLWLASERLDNIRNELRVKELPRNDHCIEVVDKNKVLTTTNFSSLRISDGLTSFQNTLSPKIFYLGANAETASDREAYPNRPYSHPNNPPYQYHETWIIQVDAF